MTVSVNYYLKRSRLAIALAIGLSLGGCLSAEMTWESTLDIVSFGLTNIPGGARVWIKMPPVAFANDCLPIEIGFMDGRGSPFAVNVNADLYLHPDREGSGADIEPSVDAACTVPFFAESHEGPAHLVLAANSASVKLYAKYRGLGVFGLNAYTTTFASSPGQASTLVTVPDAPEGLTLIAGPDSPRGYKDDVGNAARFNRPSGIAFDGASNSLYVVETANRRLRKVSIATGAVTTVAGGGPQRWGQNPDGLPGQGWFNYPTAAVYVAAEGGYTASVYVLDNSSVRRVDLATGLITTIAGDPYNGGDTDGPGASARFGYGDYLVYCAGTHSLYLSDRNAAPAKIKAISLNAGTYGTVSTAATNGAPYAFLPGALAVMGTTLFFHNTSTGYWAVLDLPAGTPFTPSGGTITYNCTAAAVGGTSLYYYCNGALKKYVWSGSIFSGSANLAGDFASSLNGSLDNADGTLARFSPGIVGMVPDATPSYIYMADIGNHGIRSVMTTGGYGAATVAGGGSGLVSVATPAASTRATTTFHYPRSLAATQGYLFSLSDQMQKVQRISPSAAAGDSTAVQPWNLSGTFSSIDALAADGSYVYVAGLVTSQRRIRRYDPSTLAEDTGFTTALNAGTYSGSAFISLAVIGPVAFATYPGSPQVWRYDLTNGATTQIGSATAGYADGIAAAASFNQPGALATDGSSLFIADTGNHVIRRLVPATLAVSTAVGTQYTGGYNGNGQSDDGPALSAKFDHVNALSARNGYLYVSEPYRHRIRRISMATNTVLTLLGGYDAVVDGVGPFGSAAVANPQALASDASNGLYIANDFNIRALK